MARKVVVLAGILAVLCFHFPLVVESAESDGCEYIGDAQDICRNEDFIVVEGQKVTKGENLVEGTKVDLSSPEKTITWDCGSSTESASWSEEGNRLRVKYFNDGNIQWKFYKCDLSGPKKAGEKCSAELIRPYHCPGSANDSNSEPCIFEREDSGAKSSSESSEIGVGLKGEVTKSSEYADAKAEVDAKASNSRHTAQEFQYKSRKYILIKPGTSYCILSDGESIKDDNAPTGFKWQCSSTKFVQGPSNSQCSGLPRCENNVCQLHDPFSTAATIQIGAGVLALSTLASTLSLL